ncbi:hypothetical protein, conserved [Babesia ovata]|uniref:Uncharacterized protein n=1 Tax=Babesia ovata TaxID=189622 RepID=A0A2H6KFM4_9APIC|nr:uncharacterized protein BOVATA_032690 [Babesia ovata]XP_028868033.1 uncharacterized protein BOVATA_032830 [Babesia ovata]GBE61776.1 hypothetical protein, conserved [Babesia ovata]GBE61790.1 hypothetical protein, conserved [Babesia ovata]
MVYHSLTEPPRNVKEGIDWLIALKGDDAKKNLKALGEAVHKFLADKSVDKKEVPALEKVKLITKEFLEQMELKGLCAADTLQGELENPMNTNPSIFVRLFGNARKSHHESFVQAQGLTAESIAENIGQVVDGCEKFLDVIKNPTQYKPAYSSEVTWAEAYEKDPETCAIIFIGIAPMLYVGIRSLKEASAHALMG